MLNGRRVGLLALAVVVIGLGATACGDVVETGPDATPGKGFKEVIVTTPPTTAGADTTDPGDSTGATTPDPGAGAASTTTPSAAGGAGGAPATTAAGGPVTTSADEPFATGDCVTWQQDAAQVRFQVVPCSDNHLVEVAGPVDLSAAFSPQTAYPTAEAIQTAVQTPCASIVAAYLGGQPASDVAPGVIPPTESSWSQGDRVAWCTVGLTLQGDQRPSYTGRVADRG